ncbi:MAG: hypothetical protein IJA86_04770 [Clostridia bacterium]|nr:hypothetical protein [Clostridia bacterium]
MKEQWNNSDYKDLSLSVTTLKGTDYYKVITDENGNVSIVNEANYIALTPQNYTLYPLNKK